MERTPAACAMDWSIHLDKSLRSNDPVKRTEAIKEVGARLELWSKEPELSMAEHDMFGLIPEEDKLFANAILLRLSDTFMSGDKHTKLCIVKIFLSELKHRKNKKFNRKNNRILSRYKVENHMELLRRMKSCFNSGDEEVRAMTLVLFGCWSDYAKDNANIRYLILSSIVSSHVLEVRASLFAGGCFCEFSDDFSRVFLEMLVNMVSSSDMPAGRIAGVRAFAKLGCSLALSSKAYEEGQKLILGSVEDDILMNMLMSLSIIASRSALLISRQVELLLSFLSPNKSLSQQATSLRCLHILLSRNRFRFSPSIELITVIFNIFNGEISPVMQNDGLHILYEILMSKTLTLNSSEINEYFTKILTVIKITIQSPLKPNRIFSTHFLADISVKFTRLINTPENENNNILASQAISVLMAQITFLTNSVPNLNQPDTEIEQEILRLFKTVNLLLNECHNLGEFGLNKVYLLINCLTNMDHKTIGSKIAVWVSKVIVLCLKDAVKNGSLTSQTENTVRVMIKCVCECNYFDNHVHVIYYLLLHSFGSCISDHEYMIKNEIFALEKVKTVMEVKDCYWSVYKAGIYAVIQGAWFTAAFIFGELITVVDSDPCHQWLTSLTLFAYSELKIMYFSSPNDLSNLLNWLVKNRSNLPIIGLLGQITKNHEIENLEGVCKILRVSKEMLSANDRTPGGKHFFRVQFLSLRVNVIETVGNLFKVLGSKGQNGHLEQLSARLLKLAREYDLIATSYIDMDPTSTVIISSHALSCSVLAFVTGFCLLFATRDFENNKSHNLMLINDLVSRIWCVDEDCSKELVLLQNNCFGQLKNGSGQLSKYRRLENLYEVRSVLVFCRFAVKGVVDLQKSAKSVHENDELRLQINNDGFELQFNVVKKWLNMFFRTPTYFFSVRPCISCQLFIMNQDSGNSKKISVLPGYHLHLDLCLQINNISPESRALLTKLYCILQCKTSSQSQTTQVAFHDWTAEDDDNSLELNEKLVNYVNKREKDSKFDEQIAETIVCFRINGNGQGFSTCVLDVSGFSLGCYEIRWRAGCLDIDGCYWSLNSVNSGPVFTVQKSC